MKSALIGMGVGAGVGVGVAAAALGATGGSDETGAFIAIVSLLGAGIGAAAGAAAGKGTKRALIYEVRRYSHATPEAMAEAVSRLARPAGDVLAFRRKQA